MRRNINVLKNANQGFSAAVPVLASQTDQSLTENGLMLHGEGARLLVAIKVSSFVTVTGSHKFSIWSGCIRSQDGVVTYRAVADKETAINANGVFEIRLNQEDAADLAKMPMGPYIKVTVTTGVGDTMTVEAIKLIEVDRPT